MLGSFNCTLRNLNQKRMLLYFIWTTQASLLFFVRVVSILVREPTDVFAVRNSTVRLPCYTNLSVPVSWEIERTGGDIIWEHFYKGYGDIPGIYQYKYNVSVDPTRGQYNLTIRNVQSEDSGTYRCGDNLGLGLRKYKEGVPGNGATAELVVIIDNEIKCRLENNFNQETKFSIATGIIKINCNLTYRGNMSPNLYWSQRILGADESRISLQTHSRSSTTTEGADSKLESELSLDAWTVPDQLYIRCEAMGRGETLLTWTSEEIVKPIDFADTSDTWAVVGYTTLAVVTLFGLVALLYRYTNVVSMPCTTIRRRRVSEILKDETTFKSTTNPEQTEELKLLEVPPNEGIDISRVQ